MSSPQHNKWIQSGMQWQLARPLAVLRDRLRNYGYTVYDIGDTSHMDHIPPEDHTPYSETGWPGMTPYGWVTAVDVMPPPTGALPSLQQLGAQIYADMQAGHAGVAWLKYMNWGPVNDRAAVHDQWEPNHVRSSSGDIGHIHLSCRSDVTQSHAGDTYDPVARLHGQMGEDMDAQTELALKVAFAAPYDGHTGINGQSWMSRAVENPLAQVLAIVKAMATKVDIDPAELTAIEEAARKGAMAAFDPQAIVDRLTPILVEHLGVDQAVVVAALQSPEGQAALIQADNTAEDH